MQAGLARVGSNSRVILAFLFSALPQPSNHPTSGQRLAGTYCEAGRGNLFEKPMKLETGVSLAGLHLLMRPVLRVAEQVWIEAGKEEGVTITCALSGEHSAGSWHYYGLALDMRTRYFSETTKLDVAQKLRTRLPNYDIVVHSTHIHIEPGNPLAAKHGLMIDGEL